MRNEQDCRRELARRVLESLVDSRRIDVDFERIASQSRSAGPSDVFHAYATSCATLAALAALPRQTHRPGQSSVLAAQRRAENVVEEAARAGLSDAQYAYFYFSVVVPLSARSPSIEVVQRAQAKVGAATALLVRAAKAGHPLAQFALAQSGPTVSTREHLMKAAAEAGLAAAQFAYGVRLLKYASEDSGRAFLRAAARQGCEPARDMLLDFWGESCGEQSCVSR